MLSVIKNIFSKNKKKKLLIFLFLTLVVFFLILKYLENNYKAFVINTPKLNNYFLLPFSFLKIFFLTVKSFFILKKNNISILISTGGYMSLPICLAAKILGINIFLIEPNMIIGRANKFFLNFSRKLICYSKNLINLPSGINQKLTTIKPLIRKEYYETSAYQKHDNLYYCLPVYSLPKIYKLSH